MIFVVVRFFFENTPTQHGCLPVYPISKSKYICIYFISILGTSTIFYFHTKDHSACAVNIKDTQGCKKSVPTVPAVQGSNGSQGEEVPKEQKKNWCFLWNRDGRTSPCAQGGRVVARMCEITVRIISVSPPPLLNLISVFFCQIPKN